MRELNVRNIALMALIMGCLTQVGAHLFGLLVAGGTVVEAPPRSFAMFTGEYGYDSSVFWDTVPRITSVLFIIALVANWNTIRRRLLVVALTTFILAAMASVFYTEPSYARTIAVGFSDTVDPDLQRQAALWYSLEWLLWSVSVAVGIVLLIALAMPIDVAQGAARRDEVASESPA